VRLLQANLEEGLPFRDTFDIVFVVACTLAFPFTLDE